MRLFGFCLMIVGLCVSFSQAYAFYMDGIWQSFCLGDLAAMAGVRTIDVVNASPLPGATSLFLSIDVWAAAVGAGVVLAICSGRPKRTAPEIRLDFQTSTSITLVVIAALVVGMGVAGLGSAIRGTTVHGAIPAATAPA